MFIYIHILPFSCFFHVYMTQKIKLVYFIFTDKYTKVLKTINIYIKQNRDILYIRYISGIINSWYCSVFHRWLRYIANRQMYILQIMHRWRIQMVDIRNSWCIQMVYIRNSWFIQMVGIRNSWYIIMVAIRNSWCIQMVDIRNNT